MKRYVITALVIGSLVAGCERAKKDRCNDFKTGTFRFTDPKLKQFKVVRDEKTQTETDSVSGLSITGNVDWKSDCHYTITYTKVSDPQYASIIGEVSNVEIIAVFDDKVVCKSVGVGGTLESEMIKIGP